MINFEDIINDIDSLSKVRTRLSESNYVMDEDRKGHDAQFIKDIWASATSMDETAKTFYLLSRWYEMVRLN